MRQHFGMRKCSWPAQSLNMYSRRSPRILCVFIRRSFIRWFWAVGWLAAPGFLEAHEEGAPFSGVIIDPPFLHHAHIENEQRLNFFALQGVPDATKVKRTCYQIAPAPVGR